MTTYMTATDARKKFYTVIDAAGNAGRPVVITHDGIPKAVVMSFDEFEGWQETVEIMMDPELSNDLLKSMKQLEEGTLETISLETLRKNMSL